MQIVSPKAAYSSAGLFEASTGTRSNGWYDFIISTTTRIIQRVDIAHAENAWQRGETDHCKCQYKQTLTSPAYKRDYLFNFISLLSTRT